MARIQFACERCNRPLGYGEECKCKETAPSAKPDAQPAARGEPEFQLDVPAEDAPAPRKRGRPKKG